ncbi:MAG TPA: phage portal protein [Phycisphaerales bacterium]|nr:phage portal protein [Phycisphaerales bacterium]
MGFDFSSFGNDNLSESFVEWLVDEQSVDVGIHFGRFWDYYHNQMYGTGSGSSGASGKSNESSRSYVQGQEVGLPARITGVSYASGVSANGGNATDDIQRKEVVIENDITWRINAMVDFLFGKEVSFVSKSPDGQRRREIGNILKAVFEANGDTGFFQNMAVLGSVYGFVDCMVRPSEEVLFSFDDTKTMRGSNNTFSSSQLPSFESILQLASTIGLELIEAPRALPVLDENDYRKIDHYVQHFYQQKNEISMEGGFLNNLLKSNSAGGKRDRDVVTEIIGAEWWQRYENKKLVSEGVNPLGVVPIVHIQNIAQPYYYEGISDVEQLIGLQDELNTRLSDRASRITFQAFKMYLAKGLEGVDERSISPGRMWCTDNPDASIEPFGGDSAMPSENMHISEIREAMDKVSGVTPVVAGVLKNKLGNLTSGVALRMTFMGMLAKTVRKQYTYGTGLKQIARLVLRTLDVCRIYPTTAEEREIEIIFPDPLPENMAEKLKEAQIKKELGVSQQQVLRELGYEEV